MSSDLDRITTVVLGMPGPSGAGITPGEKTAIDSRLTALESGLMINADDFADLNDAIAASAAHGGVPVWVPTARTQTTPVTIPDALKDGFRMWGLGPAAPITYSGAGAFLTVDPSATPTNLTQRTHWELRNLSIVGPGSGSAGSIGLKINNSAVGLIYDVKISGFEKGVVYDNLNNANSASCYYNDAYHLRIRLCKDAVTLQNGANSNSFHGGSWVSSERGIVISNGNNISVIGVDIESNTIYGAYIDGNTNHFIGCRFENPSATKEIIFYDGNGRGVGNQVMSFFVEVAIDGAITWDANHDNLVIGSGYLNLGSSDAGAETFVINAKRTAAADAEPFVKLADEYSSSGAPIGYQYTAVRSGSIGFLMVKNDGAGGLWPVVQIDYQTGGKPHLTFGDGTALAQDTNLFRNAANTLKTDDSLIVGIDLQVLGNIGFYGHATAAKPTVTGSKGANAALTSLLTALAGLGLLTDSST